MPLATGLIEIRDIGAGAIEPIIARRIDEEMARGVCREERIQLRTSRTICHIPQIETAERVLVKRRILVPYDAQVVVGEQLSSVPEGVDKRNDPDGLNAPRVIRYTEAGSVRSVD